MQFQERKMEKRMKKRILAGIVAVCTVLSLAGCSGEIKNDNIKITQYKELEVEKVEVAEVTDEEVEASIASTLVTIDEAYGIKDRAVVSGDTIIMDYVGKVDGEEFQGGSAEKANLKIGSGSFIPGFEDAIIGHMPGETFDINVTFPEEYSAELAGKDAVFTITLHYIIPELTEELVPVLSSKFKTIEEYKAQVKKDLEVSNEATAKESLKEAALAALVENCVVEKYPEDRLEELVTDLDSYVEYLASMYQMEKEAYLEAAGISVEEVAKEVLKQELAIELIAKKKKLTFSEEEYNKALAEYATQAGFESAEACEEAYGAEEMERVLLKDRVAEFLVENCKQVEKKSE